MADVTACIAEFKLRHYRQGGRVQALRFSLQYSASGSLAEPQFSFFPDSSSCIYALFMWHLLLR